VEVDDFRYLGVPIREKYDHASERVIEQTPLYWLLDSERKSVHCTAFNVLL